MTRSLFHKGHLEPPFGPRCDCGLTYGPEACPQCERHAYDDEMLAWWFRRCVAVTLIAALVWGLS